MLTVRICFQALLELGSPSERRRCKLACDRRAKCYEQHSCDASYHLDQFGAIFNLVFNTILKVFIEYGIISTVKKITNINEVRKWYNLLTEFGITELGRALG